MLATLAKGTSVLHNILDSEDTQTAIQICRALGAEIHISPEQLTLHSQGVPFLNCAQNIETGNSGISTLFTLPLLGLKTNFETFNERMHYHANYSS